MAAPTGGYSVCGLSLLLCPLASISHTARVGWCPCQGYLALKHAPGHALGAPPLGPPAGWLWTTHISSCAHGFTGCHWGLHTGCHRKRKCYAPGGVVPQGYLDDQALTTHRLPVPLAAAAAAADHAATLADAAAASVAAATIVIAQICGGGMCVQPTGSIPGCGLLAALLLGCDAGTAAFRGRTRGSTSCMCTW